MIFALFFADRELKYIALTQFAVTFGGENGKQLLPFSVTIRTNLPYSGLCEQNTFSVDGAPPCIDCPEGETSGLGATACVPSQGRVSAGKD